jgi:predicted transcriptional regulator
MKAKHSTKMARDVEVNIADGEYELSERELAGIDRGLRAADEGRFASDQQVEAALARLRNA